MAGSTKDEPEPVRSAETSRGVNSAIAVGEVAVVAADVAAVVATVVGDEPVVAAVVGDEVAPPLLVAVLSLSSSSPQAARTMLPISRSATTSARRCQNRIRLMVCS